MKEVKEVWEVKEVEEVALLKKRVSEVILTGDCAPPGGFKSSTSSTSPTSSTSSRHPR